VTLDQESPELFADAPGFAAATFPDGAIVSAAKPARPGDVVVLYATGLGRTTPALAPGHLATSAAPIERLADFRCSLAGKDAGVPLYVGLTAGFAGLYQINLRVPEGIPADPEVRIGFKEPSSVPGLKLPVRP
jgi:uncharacterized protein (TIGR03437 family)